MKKIFTLAVAMLLWGDFRTAPQFYEQKLTVALKFRDVFDSTKQRLTSYNNMNFTREDITGSRTFRISVTYKFNAASSKYKGIGVAQEEKARL